MSREKMVKRVVRLFKELPPPSLAALGPSNEEFASRILDAILPQVTTVAELESTHTEAILIDRKGDTWWADIEPHRWWSATAEHGWPSVDVISDRAPLTVVWQPED